LLTDDMKVLYITEFTESTTVTDRQTLPNIGSSRQRRYGENFFFYGTILILHLPPGEYAVRRQKCC
jgi:hypothetical protein